MLVFGRVIWIWSLGGCSGCFAIFTDVLAPATIVPANSDSLRVSLPSNSGKWRLYNWDPPPKHLKYNNPAGHWWEVDTQPENHQISLRIRFVERMTFGPSIRKTKAIDAAQIMASQFHIAEVIYIAVEGRNPRNCLVTGRSIVFNATFIMFNIFPRFATRCIYCLIRPELLGWLSDH